MYLFFLVQAPSQPLLQQARAGTALRLLLRLLLLLLLLRLLLLLLLLLRLLILQNKHLHAPLLLRDHPRLLL